MTVDGNLVAIGAISIGAGLIAIDTETGLPLAYTPKPGQYNDITSNGAIVLGVLTWAETLSTIGGVGAITIGAASRAGNVDASGAVVLGANTQTSTIKAAAAVTIGAGSTTGRVISAAVTVGAGAKTGRIFASVAIAKATNSSSSSVSSSSSCSSSSLSVKFVSTPVAAHFFLHNYLVSMTRTVANPLEDV